MQDRSLYIVYIYIYLSLSVLVQDPEVTPSGSERLEGPWPMELSNQLPISDMIRGVHSPLTRGLWSEPDRPTEATPLRSWRPWHTSSIPTQNAGKVQ